MTSYQSLSVCFCSVYQIGNTLRNGHIHEERPHELKTEKERRKLIITIIIFLYIVATSIEKATCIKQACVKFPKQSNALK